MHYWLMKAALHLRSGAPGRAPRRTTGWDGVRNYQARNICAIR
jgi:predicted RNA-binding protein with PUA-like domain